MSLNKTQKKISHKKLYSSFAQEKLLWTDVQKKTKIKMHIRSHSSQIGFRRAYKRITTETVKKF